MNTIGQIDNFMVIKNKLYFKYSESYHSFLNELNNYSNDWRRKLVRILQKNGTEFPDPVFTQKERKILILPIKVTCTDKTVECELCLRKINFDDGSIGYYNMFLV